jgi:D-alanyl-lipoteichoic acid acyltransferase DltB (MBOAT superfamily)
MLKDYLQSIFGFDPARPLLFTEFYFWAFFLLVMCVFSLLHKKRVARSIFLFAVSLFFYWKTSGLFFLLLIFSTFYDYFIGLLLDKSNTSWKRKALVASSIFVNLFSLIYFKYAYFFTDSYNQIFLANVPPEQKMHVINWLAKWINDFSPGMYQWIASLFHWENGFADFTTHFKVDKILLPVGVSFFTFQTISYSVDVYRREIKAVRNMFDFGFYVAYFPQLVAGPIVRASEFVPQIYKPFNLTRFEFGLAIFWILNGLIKKLILSDYLAGNYIDRVFDSPEIYGGLGNVLALLLYSLQVYADFSGYTDIAIGVSLFMGFRLPMNFNSPYKAKNVGEFWKRWHMSLSTWLKDYLYIPLGGNKKASFGTFFWLLLIGVFIVIMPGSMTFLTTQSTLSLCVLVFYFSLLFPLLKKKYQLIFTLCIGVIFTLKYIINDQWLNSIFDIGIFPWYVLLIIVIVANIILSFTFKKTKNNLVTNINLMLTMVIGGLWHGASWNFLIWGALNGGALIIYKSWKRISPYEKSNFWLVNAWKIFFTFVFISFTRLFFRAGDIKNANAGMETVERMWKQITSNWDMKASIALLEGYWKIWVVFIIGMIIHWLPVSLKDWYRKTFAKSPVYVKIAIVVAAVFIVLQSISAELQTFIYFQF